MQGFHRLFQLCVVAAMAMFGLVAPTPAAAMSGCWVCVNWQGQCPEPGLGQDICDAYCGGLVYEGCSGALCVGEPNVGVVCGGAES